MIDKRLDKLGKYAEKLDNEGKINLIINYYNKNKDELIKILNEKSVLEKKLDDNIYNIINYYENKGLSELKISSHIFNILTNLIKKSMIESMALSLGINKTLYKKEMRFLFKGSLK